MKLILALLLTAALLPAQSAPPRVVSAVERPTGAAFDLVLEDNFSAGNIVSVQIVALGNTTCNTYLATSPGQRAAYAFDFHANTWQGPKQFGEAGKIGWPCVLDTGEATVAVLNPDVPMSRLAFLLPFEYAQNPDDAFVYVFNAQYRYTVYQFRCAGATCGKTVASAARIVETGTWYEDASGRGVWLQTGGEYRLMERPR